MSATKSRGLLGVELHRSGQSEPPLGLQAVDSAPGLYHVRVRVDLLLLPLGEPLGVSDVAGDEAAVRGEGLHTVVGPVADVDVAFRIDRNVRRPVQLAGPGAIGAK